MELFIPQTIEEAVGLLDDTRRIVAGGTDVCPGTRCGKLKEKDLISIHQLNKLESIIVDNEKVRIGSRVTFAQLVSWAACPKSMKAVQTAAGLVGSPQIRNRGTIGGNIMTASPAADIVPVLAALGAEAELISSAGRQMIAVETLMTTKRISAQPYLLTAVHIPQSGGLSVFSKVGKRQSMAISVVNQAVYMEIRAGKISRIGIVCGSVGPYMMRARLTEAYLAGKSLSDLEENQMIRHAVELVKAEIRPIDDVRASADYRREVCGHVLDKHLKELIRWYL